MKRINLCLFLTLALFAMSLPASSAQDAPANYQPSEDLIASYQSLFQAELTAYAANHTDAEVKAYAEASLNQITTFGLDDPFSDPATATTNSPSAFPLSPIRSITATRTCMEAIMSFVSARALRNADACTTPNCLPRPRGQQRSSPVIGGQLIHRIHGYYV